jgi:hypothetical protein
MRASSSGGDRGCRRPCAYFYCAPPAPPACGYYPVREPSTWALMLLGFAGLGIAGVRASWKRVAADA